MTGMPHRPLSTDGHPSVSSSFSSALSSSTVFASTLAAIHFPEVTSKKAQAKVAKISKMIDEIIIELQTA